MDSLSEQLSIASTEPSSIPTSATAPANSTSSVTPSTDIAIDPNPNSNSSSTGWGPYEQLKPEANSPIVANTNDYTFENRPMVGSPIMENDQQSKHEKFGSFPAAPVIFKQAGFAVNILFPGFSSKKKSSQDVYTIEPPPSKHHTKSLQGNVHLPATYTIGSGKDAQTVGPMNVRIVASQ